MPLQVKNPPANAGDVSHVGQISGLGRSHGGGHGNLLQYSCQKNPMDRAKKCWTWLMWLGTHVHTSGLKIHGLKPQILLHQQKELFVKWAQLYSSWNILWHCRSLGLEGKLTFPSSVATDEFSNFADILSAGLKQHHLLGFEIAHLDFHYLHQLCLQ